MELFSLCLEKGNCYDNSVMETFFGRLKTGKYIMALKWNIHHSMLLRGQLKNTSTITTIKGFRKKQNGCPKIQGSIHVFRLVNNMCPGKWVHIILSVLLLYHFIDIN